MRFVHLRRTVTVFGGSCGELGMGGFGNSLMAYQLLLVLVHEMSHADDFLNGEEANLDPDSYPEGSMEEKRDAYLEKALRLEIDAYRTAADVWDAVKTNWGPMDRWNTANSTIAQDYNRAAEAMKAGSLAGIPATPNQIDEAGYDGAMATMKNYSLGTQTYEDYYVKPWNAQNGTH